SGTTSIAEENTKFVPVTEQYYQKGLVSYDPFLPITDIFWLSPESISERDTLFHVMFNARKVVLSGRPPQLMIDMPISKPTAFSAPPIVWQAIVDQIKTKKEFRKFFGSRISIFGIGGAIVSDQLLSEIKNKYSIDIKNQYGSTELGGILDEGRPFYGVKVTIFDDDGKESDQGEMFVWKGAQ
ncbi:MAG: hypothetical protein EZS28_005895, partial [Streblomastix strix]